MRAAAPCCMGLVVLALAACGQTSYDLYDTTGPNGAAGSLGTGGDASGPPPSGGSATGGEATGGGPMDEAPLCVARRDASLTLHRIVLADQDLCLARGEATIFIDSPGYEVVLAPCSEDESQWWTVDGLSGGSWELRNEDTNLNLDMNYAATTDGTPAVLFDAHRNFNQRFYIGPGTNESIIFAPAHVQGKCLEVREGALEMWPCDAEIPSQNFRQISCVDED